MMDFAAVDLSVRSCRIQAIALRQEVLQRSLLRFKEFFGWPVSRLKSSTRRAWMRTIALILNPALDFVAPHARIEIGQMKGHPCPPPAYSISTTHPKNPTTRLPLSP